MSVLARFRPTALAVPEIPRSSAAAEAPAVIDPGSFGAVAMLVPSLTRGGAERIVAELAQGLGAAGVPGLAIVLRDDPQPYALQPVGQMQVLRLGALPAEQRLKAAIAALCTGPDVPVYTHLIRRAALEELWQAGLHTVPVIHNAPAGWLDPAESYDHPQIPFIVAVSEDVAQALRCQGLGKPVRVIRHKLLPRLPVPSGSRAQIRAALGVAPGELLIGMVGRFKLQKAYTRAVRVLGAVTARRPARLAILGGWSHGFGQAAEARHAVELAARESGLRDRLILAGDVSDVEPWLDAFDVYLNTSVYEGLSIATLEAQRAGLPVVASDAGGQRELIGPLDRLLPQDATPEAYAAAILAAAALPRAPGPPRNAADRAALRLWSWLAARDGERTRDGVLFITANLNAGGAQRSLVNLLSHLPGSDRALLAVTGPTTIGGHVETLAAAGRPVVALPPLLGPADRADRLLALAEQEGVATICFWNLDAPTKLAVAAALAGGPIRLVDASPGPLFFTELEAAAPMAGALAFGPVDYLAALDCLIAKYAGGLPAGLDPARIRVVPNGVVQPVGIAPRRILPPGWDPALAIVTTGRIVPDKHLEILIEAARLLGRRVPGASLSIAGAVDPRHQAYADDLARQIRRDRIDNVHFLGSQPDVFAYLGGFAAFVLVSRHQGCPNASLEAMAAGLPVVANDDGGTREQVIDGETGYLLAAPTAEAIAARLAALLRDPALARRMGAAGRVRARQHFSISAMVSRYRAALEFDASPREGTSTCSSGSHSG
jgi:glycosyltransferase involved in cell wall biosynthesis